MAVHPRIKAFETCAEVLDLQGSVLSIDDAIARLAGWMDFATDRLTADDMTVLTDIGAVLYREGLAKRYREPKKPPRST